MDNYHGYTCPTGCIDRKSMKPGLILQFSPSCLANITQQDMAEELVVILRLPKPPNSNIANIDDFYHCAVVTKLPDPELGPVRQVNLVHSANITFLHSLGQPTLYVVEEARVNASPRCGSFTRIHGQYVQPTNIKRISAKCLHNLPGCANMVMDPVSVEIILKGVERIACSPVNAGAKEVLPEGMKCQRRQENILVLSLLRSIDRGIGQDPHQSGRSMERGRAQSIWLQAGVPRDGGR
ncbi:hypothetical protein GJ744_009914 [Endocarpon pusillum]|uniref:Uncharacterized protein n=1 Tax=Endocarpon pusillum TaxID=364733 RepID=A0A8H7E3H7_9EURO|nr:hypothetical protein GJ744_009914 [Endocarpon pusillum]